MVHHAPTVSAVTLALDNLLPTDFPARDSLERIVRSVFADVPGGPWVIKLKRSTVDPSRVSVEVRGQHRVLLTSFEARTSDDQISLRLKMFSRPGRAD
jgi:hypothetical protein